MKLSYFLAICVCFLYLSFSSVGQPILKTFDVSKGIKIQVPQELQVLNAAERKMRNLSTREPLAAFVSKDGRVNLGLSTAPILWADEDLNVLKSFYKSKIQNLYGSVQFDQDTLTEIRGRQFIVFEGQGETEASENAFSTSSTLSIYFYTQYTIYNNQILISYFTCPAPTSMYWKDTVKEIMTTLRLKN